MSDNDQQLEQIYHPENFEKAPEDMIVANVPQLPIAKIKRLVELDKQYDAIKKERDLLREQLLVATQQLDVLTLKTGEYTISRAKRLTPRVTGYETLKKSLDTANIPYETYETFTPQMTVLFKQIIKEGKKLDGLEISTVEYISIRVRGDK